MSVVAKVTAHLLQQIRRHRSGNPDQYLVVEGSPSSQVISFEKRNAIKPEKLVTYEQAKSVHAYRAKLNQEPLGSFPSPREWLMDRIKALPILRNHLAHGSPSLDLFGSLRHLEFCADLINALFPSTPAAS